MSRRPAPGAAAGAAAWLLAALACGGDRAGPPEALFAPPPDTILTRYVNVPTAAWLGSGRWVVVAPEFSEAAIADFGTRSARVLGGRGPGAGPVLEGPFAVFAVGDTAYVTDGATRRITTWSAGGAPLGSVPAPAALRGALPRARDAMGRWYFEIAPRPNPDGSSNRDSAVVVRADAGLARFDTVARLTPLDLAEVDDERGHRFERRVFSGTDQWGVAGDGTLWLARVYPNRVDRVTPEGKAHRGPALPDRIIEVTQTDRDHWLLQYPEELRSTAERLPFAPLKPPFEAGHAAPGGRIWLEKSRPVADSVRSYHVVEPSGALGYVAVLPIRQGHVIAVGDGVALVAEQYAGGVRLMQAPIPEPVPPGP